MASRITELVLDCRDPAGLAAWWAEVLGYEVVGTEDDGSVEIGPPRPRPEARPERARGEEDGVLSYAR